MKRLLLLPLFITLTFCSSAPKFSESDLKAPFVNNRIDIENCYRQALKINPDIKGTLELKFLVNEDGKAYKTLYRKTNSTISNKILNVCIKRAVEKWQFPKGKEMEIVYPFHFEKKGSQLSSESISQENTIEAAAPSDKKLIIIQDNTDSSETSAPLQQEESENESPKEDSDNSPIFE